MSSDLNMDPAQIAANADKLRDLVQQRVQREQVVADTATQLVPSFTGEAATALQNILARYLDTAERLRNEEASLAEKLDHAQKTYTATDSGSAQALSATMGI
jgi:uncharacterized protein YukE